jgi:hypothetical protein
VRQGCHPSNAPILSSTPAELQILLVACPAIPSSRRSIVTTVDRGTSSATFLLLRQCGPDRTRRQPSGCARRRRAPPRAPARFDRGRQKRACLAGERIRRVATCSLFAGLQATRSVAVGFPLQIDEVGVQRVRFLLRHRGLDPRPARRRAVFRHAFDLVASP